MDSTQILLIASISMMIGLMLGVALARPRSPW